MNELRIKEKRQDSENAIKNFDEVSFGYTKEEVILEAKRCLNCKNTPCLNGCPLHNNIPLVMKHVSEGNFVDARNTINLTQAFPEICGRVCSQELQCEGKCTRGLIKGQEPISIGLIERFIGDNFKNLPERENLTDKKVAIIGSGPSGLACAYRLILSGIKPVIFEKKPLYGGLLRYGIPEFCLPNSKIDDIVNTLKDLGVEFKNNVLVGKDIEVKDLEKEFDAIYLAYGSNVGKKMRIENESAIGVTNSSDYLDAVNGNLYPSKDYENIVKNAKNVVVVGGGNASIDVDRVALRLGANKVINVYRRSEVEMPARKVEFDNAKQENIEFEFLTNPTKINVDQNNRLKSITCIKMELGEPDESGRRRPIEVKGSEFDIDCDLVVMALGANSENKVYSDEIYNEWGFVNVNDETKQTSIEKIFAGGDVVRGPSFVVKAIDDGQKAAKSIKNYLMNK